MVDQKSQPLRAKKQVKRSKKRKFLRCILYSLLFLIIVVCSLLYYFIGTNQGLKKGITLINHFSDYQIQADKINGKLSDQVSLDGLLVTGNGLVFRSKRVNLNWNINNLWRGDLSIDQLIIDQSQLDLSNYQPKDLTPKDNEQSDPFEFKNIDLPITLLAKNIAINHFDLITADSSRVEIDQFNLAFSFVGNTLSIDQMALKSPSIDFNTTAKLQTINDYPIQWSNQLSFRDEKIGNETLTVKIAGDIANKIDLDIIGDGFASFTWQASVTDVLKKLTVDSQLQLDQLNLSSIQEGMAVKGNLAVTGHLLENRLLNTEANIQYFSEQTKNIGINLSATLDKQTIDLKKTKLTLIDNKQSLDLVGHVDLPTKALRAKLTGEQVGWPQLSEPVIVAKNIDLDLSGTLDDYQGKGKLNILLKDIPTISLLMNLSGNTTALTDIDLIAKLSKGQIESKGHLTWSPALSFDVKTTGDGIQASKNLPSINGLAIDLNGTLTKFVANLKGKFSSKVIPETEIDTSVSGNLDQDSVLKGVVKTMGGEINLDATMKLKPDFWVDASLSSESINLNKLSNELHSDLNSDILLSVSQKNNQMFAKATIEKLTGTFQHQAVLGKGIVEYKDGELNIDEVDISLAQNQLKANGSLGEKVALDFSLEANHLNQLIPDLSGKVNLSGSLAGALDAPAADLKMTANQLHYQDYKLGNLLLASTFDLAKDKVDIDLDLKGLEASGVKVSRTTATVSGKITNHQIKFALDSDQGKINLLAGAGFSKDKEIWSTQLNQLVLTKKEIGDWRLQKVANLRLSKTELWMKDFCLYQEQSRVCADGDLKSNKGLNVKVVSLKTKAFRKLMPNVFRINTTLDLDSHISLAGQYPEIMATLKADGGNINLVAPTGGVRSKINQLHLNLSIKDNALKSDAHVDLDQLVKADINYKMKSITNKDIFLDLKLKADDLDFVKSLVPQITDISGKIDGDITVAGQIDQDILIKGELGLLDASLLVPEYGTDIHHLSFKVFSKDENVFAFLGGAQSDENGQISFSGGFDPRAQNGTLNITGENFLVANSKKLRVKITPNIQTSLAETIVVRGDILIPEAMIVPESSGESKITPSEDVVLSVKKKKENENKLLDMELAINLGDDVRVANADIETRLLGGINIIAKPAQVMRATGSIQVETGELRVYGQLLNIERGRIIFDRGPISDPALDIRTTREIEDESITVGADVLGRVSSPEVSLFSTPSMSDSSILSYLLFGKAPDSESFGAAALLQTGGLVGANTVARDLKHSMGLDVLNLSFSGMEAGKNLTDKIYVGIRSNFFEAVNQLLLEYKINTKFKLEGALGTEEDSYADFIYTRSTD